MDELIIGGLTPLSTLDFPGVLAAVVYCRGCPWNCPYCHNAGLRDLAGPGEWDFDGFARWLEGRRGLLDAVVFSGGEPTLQPGLGDAMARVRDMGFQIGLHTAGMFPEALAAVLPDTDWVGLDIKAPRAAYDRITGAPGSGEAAFASLGLLMPRGKSFEVRTTWHPALLDTAALAILAGELEDAGAGQWVLQAFRPYGCADASLAAAGPAVFPPELLPGLQAAAPSLTVTSRE